MYRQCRYCVFAIETGARYVCRCVIWNTHVSLYSNCENFSNDYNKKEGLINAINEIRNRSSRQE